SQWHKSNRYKFSAQLKLAQFEPICLAQTRPITLAQNEPKYSTTKKNRSFSSKYIIRTNFMRKGRECG
ncbi:MULTISPECIES: hypothetical protein, partial [Arenibacter]|uniref:hypothetical protein n=1 Tax=Arenibacter TaxID=178469 RepID=UPI001966BF01